MAKTKNKTIETRKSVAQFIKGISPQKKQDDSKELLKLMKEVTGAQPKMWGTSIVGFGKYHYRYESGREGVMPKVGFSPRKQALTLYIMPGFDEITNRLQNLGTHSIGKSCLYIKKLDDVDLDVLKGIVKYSWDSSEEKFG